MPKYTIQDSQTGRTLTVEGDSEPTQADMTQLFDANPPPEPKSNVLFDSVRRLGEGASVGVGQTLQGLARLGDMYNRGVSENWRTINKYNPITAIPHWILDSAAPYVPGDLTTSPLAVYGKDYVEQPAADAYGVDRLRDETIVGQLSSSAGQMLPTIATGVLTGPMSIPASMVQYGLASGEQQAQEAEKAMPGNLGVSDKAFTGGAASGALSEGILGVAGRLGKIALGKHAVPKILKSLAKKSPILAHGVEGFLREAGQEGLEQVGQNLTASDYAGYDPTRKITKDVGQSMLLGGLMGGPMGAGAQALHQFSQRNAANPGQPQPPPPVAPVDPVNPVDSGDPVADAEFNAAVQEMGGSPAPVTQQFVDPAEAEGRPQPADSETTARQAFMITREMESDLRSRGYTQEQINKMTPERANEILSEPFEPTESKPSPTSESTEDKPLSKQARIAERILVRAGFDAGTARSFGRFYSDNFFNSEQTAEDFRDNLLKEARSAGFRFPKNERTFREFEEAYELDVRPEDRPQMVRNAIEENNRLEAEATAHNQRLMERFPKNVQQAPVSETAAPVSEPAPDSQGKPAPTAETGAAGETASQKPVEQMTPEEHANHLVKLNNFDPDHVTGFSPDGMPIIKSGTSSAITIRGTRSTLKEAIENGRPINAELFDGYNKSSERPIALPEGWTRNGDLLEPPVKQTAPSSAPAAETGAKGKDITQKLEDWADGVIRENRGKFLSPSPTILAAYGVKGSAIIGRGIKQFAQWSVEMIREYGDAIRPHLESIYQKSLGFNQPNPNTASAATFRGTSIDEWNAVKNGESFGTTIGQTKDPVTGKVGGGQKVDSTWAIEDREYAARYAGRNPGGVLIEFKPESRSKFSQVIEGKGGGGVAADNRLNGKGITLDDVAKVYDHEGKVIYDASESGSKETASTPAATGAKGSNVLNVQSNGPNAEARYNASLDKMTSMLEPDGELVVNMPDNNHMADWMTPKRLQADLLKRFNQVERTGLTLVASGLKTSSQEQPDVTNVGDRVRKFINAAKSITSLGFSSDRIEKASEKSYQIEWNRQNQKWEITTNPIVGRNNPSRTIRLIDPSNPYIKSGESVDLIGNSHLLASESLSEAKEALPSLPEPRTFSGIPVKGPDTSTLNLPLFSKYIDYVSGEITPKEVKNLQPNIDSFIDSLNQKKATQAGLGQKIDAAIESLKIKPGGLYSLPDLGLTVTLWNGTLNAVQIGIRAGQKLSEAIQTSIDWLRAQGQQFNESRVRAELDKAILQNPSLRVKSQTIAGRTVGTSQPTTVTRTGEGTDPDHNVDLSRLRESNPTAYRKNAILLTRYPVVARDQPRIAKLIRKIDAPLLAAQNALAKAQARLDALKKEAVEVIASTRKWKKSDVKGKHIEGFLDRNRRSDLAERFKIQRKEIEVLTRLVEVESGKSKAAIAELVKDQDQITLKDADAIYESYIKAVESNLETLAELFPKRLRDLATLWYDGANLIGQRFGKKYRTTLEQASAVLAVFSPQKDWFMNVSLAERMMAIWQDQQDAVWSPEMTRQFIKRSGEPKPRMMKGEDGTLVEKTDQDGNILYQGGAVPVEQEDGSIVWTNWDNAKAAQNMAEAKQLLLKLEGKRLRDLTDPALQARFVRMFSEVNHPINYQKVAPDGEFVGNMTNPKGKEMKIAWGGYGTIEKAIRILQSDKASEHDAISEALGDQHKVRSFYNNIVDPQNKSGHVTMDTHAVAALLWLPLSGASVEVTQNFGGKGVQNDGAAGIKGTYAANAEAYRRAAQALGLLPRELQSITWEAVRMLFPAKWKGNKENVANVRAVWERYLNNELTIKQARAEIFRLATTSEEHPQGRDIDRAIKDGSGVGEPSWAATMGDGASHVGDVKEADDAGILSGGGRVGGLGSGQRTGDSGGVGERQGSAPVVRPTEKGRDAGRLDKVETLLQKAIDSLKNPGLTNDPFLINSAIRPVARLALKAALAIYRTTRNVGLAIAEGMRVLRDSEVEFDEKEGEDWLRAKVEIEPKTATTEEELESIPAKNRSAEQAARLKKIKDSRSVFEKYTDTSKSALGEYQYLREAPKGESSNARQRDFAKKLADHHGENFNAAIAEMNSIDVPSFREVVRAEITARVAVKMGMPGSAHFMEMQPLLTQLTSGILDAKTEAGQALQAQLEVNKVLDPHKPLLAFLELLKIRQKKAVDSKLGPDAVDKVRKAVTEASNNTGNPMESEDSKVLKILRKFTKKARSAVPENLAAKIMESLGPLANWREKFTQKGTKSIADTFAKLAGLSKKTGEPGNVATFESLVSRELGRLLKEAMKTAGFDVDAVKNAKKDVASEIAMFIGKDPLQSDKLEKIDKLVREKLKENPELLDLWDEVSGYMGRNAPSSALLKKAVNEAIKELKVDWSKVLDPAYVAKQRQKVVADIIAKVEGKKIPGQTSGLNISETRAGLESVFDGIAQEKQNKAEANEIYRRAKAALSITAEPEQSANAILNAYAKTQSDTPSWTVSQGNVIRKIFSEYLKWNETPDSFRSKMKDAGLGQSLTERLLNVANREQEIRRAIDRIKAEEKFTKWLNDEGAVQSLLKKVASSLGQNWRELFRDLPENQTERRAKILERANQDPRFADLSESTRNAVVKAFDAAWERQRLEIFRAEFSKLVPLPNVDEATKEKVKDSIPEIFKMANQGLLDNESFRNALAKSLGIESLDGPTAKKIAEIGQRIQKAPEGLVRNKLLEEARTVVQNSNAIDVADLLKSFWYANVLSGTGTWATIGMGGGTFGAVHTLMAALDAAFVLRRPDVSLRMIGEFVKSIPEGARNLYDIVTTGDYSRIPGFEAQLKDSLESRFRSNSFEKLLKSKGWKGKVLGSPGMVPRLVTGLDQMFSPGVRNAGAFYAALSRGERESIGLLMQKSDKAKTAAAREQAINEFKASGVDKPKGVDLLARQREILEQEVNRDVLEGAEDLAREANLNLHPKGIGGEIYNFLSPMSFFVKMPLGATFLRAAINLMQNGSNWMPASGAINYFRSSPAFRKNLKKWNVSEGWVNALSPDLKPEQRRMVALKQIAGLAVVLMAANKFLSAPKDDDKDGWEIAGSGFGLTPNQLKARNEMGIRPNSFYKIDKKTGKMKTRSFQEWPMAASLAMIANMRDAQIYRGVKWTEKSAFDKIRNGWLMGLSYVGDLPMLKQAADLFGTSASERGMDPEEFGEKMSRRTQKAVGSFVAGAVPFSSLLKDIDVWSDPNTYRPDNKNPGYGIFLRNLPFARRLSASEPALNILGEPIKDQRGPLSKIIRDQQNSPEMNALADKLADGVFPSWPGKTTKVVDAAGSLREMTEKEWREFSKAHGQKLKEVLANNLEEFKDMPQEAALLDRMIKGEAEAISKMTPGERLEKEKQIRSYARKNSADGWLRTANTDIGNLIRREMGFSPIDAPEQ